MQKSSILESQPQICHLGSGSTKRTSPKCGEHRRGTSVINACSNRLDSWHEITVPSISLSPWREWVFWGLGPTRCGKVVDQNGMITMRVSCEFISSYTWIAFIRPIRNKYIYVIYSSLMWMGWGLSVRGCSYAWKCIGCTYDNCSWSMRAACRSYPPSAIDGAHVPSQLSTSPVDFDSLRPRPLRYRYHYRVSPSPSNWLKLY